VRRIVAGLLLVPLVDAGDLVDHNLDRPQDQRKECTFAVEHARHIGAERRRGLMRGNGRGRDQAALRGGEQGVRSLRQEPRGPGVDREGSLVIRERQVEQARSTDDAGVAHQPIEAAEGALRRLDHPGGSGRVGEIGHADLRMRPFGAQQ